MSLLLVTEIPILDALLEQWGQENRPLVQACRSFFEDFEKRYRAGREERWRTPLFRKQDPLVRQSLKEIRSQLGVLDQRATLLRSGQALRQALRELENEERGFPVFSPHFYLQRLGYLTHGWIKEKLPTRPLSQFLTEYGKLLENSERTLEEAQRSGAENPESERLSVQVVEESKRFGRRIGSLKRAVQKEDRVRAKSLLQDALALGERIYDLHQELESSLNPLPSCPFCGAELSGPRCGGCGRVLPVEVGSSSFSTAEQAAEQPEKTAYVARVEEAVAAHRSGQLSETDFLATLDWFRGQVQRGLTQLSQVKLPRGVQEDSGIAQCLKDGGAGLVRAAELLRVGDYAAGLELLGESERLVMEGQARAREAAEGSPNRSS